MAMDVVDYEIFGDDMQYVEVELDPNEAVVGEAGSMFYMEDQIRMETIFGDGSASSSGFMGSLLGAGKRLLTGESLFTTVYSNQGSGKRKVAFGAPYPGRIIPVHLDQIGGTLLCQKDAFLCAAKSAYHCNDPGLPIASGFAIFSMGVPSKSFLIGSSIFLPVSVRGISGTAKTSFGTWRAESCLRILSHSCCFSVSSSRYPSRSTTNSGI